MAKLWVGIVALTIALVFCLNVISSTLAIMPSASIGIMQDSFASPLSRPIAELQLSQAATQQAASPHRILP